MVMTRRSSGSAREAASGLPAHVCTCLCVSVPGVRTCEQAGGGGGSGPGPTEKQLPQEQSKHSLPPRGPTELTERSSERRRTELAWRLEMGARAVHGDPAPGPLVRQAQGWHRAEL